MPPPPPPPPSRPPRLLHLRLHHLLLPCLHTRLAQPDHALWTRRPLVAQPTAARLFLSSSLVRAQVVAMEEQGGRVGGGVREADDGGRSSEAGGHPGGGSIDAADGEQAPVSGGEAATSTDLLPATRIIGNTTRVTCSQLFPHRRCSSSSLTQYPGCNFFWEDGLSVGGGSSCLQVCTPHICLDVLLKVGQELLRTGTRTKWVIIKMGSKGSIMITESVVSCAPSFKVLAVLIKGYF